MRRARCCARSCAGYSVRQQGHSRRERGKMEGFLDADQLEFRDHLRRWVDERLKPRAEELDRTGDFARDLFEELGSLGYFGIMYPEQYGGMGLDAPYVYYTILCDELAAASMGFAATVCMH